MIIAAVALGLLTGCGVNVPPGGEELVEESGEKKVEYVVLGVPTLSVVTPGNVGINSRSTYVEGATAVLMMTVAPKDDLDSPRDSIRLLGPVSIKGRGNSTWTYEKKPYMFKTEKKTSLLGMAESRSWCLLANYLDRSLLRNDIAFEVSRRLGGMPWTPDGEFVDLVLNGQALGNYFLCQHISISKEKVNLGPEGYILELDTYYDEPYKFKSSLGFPVMVKDYGSWEGETEEALTASQLNYIKARFNKVETLLTRNLLEGTYREYIDIDSFVDWWLANELVGNGEACHPKSSYMTFDGEAFLAGPVWDFDWYTLNPGMETFRIKDTIWYRYLFQDPYFVSVVRKRWTMARKSLEALPDYIDQRAEQIRESALRNTGMWTINQEVNPDCKMSWDDAVAHVRSAYKERFKRIDSTISSNWF